MRRGKQRILLTDVPPSYTVIHSSLGEALPANIVVLSCCSKDRRRSSNWRRCIRSGLHITFLEQLTQSIGVSSTPLKPRCERKTCCNSRSSLRRNCNRSRKS